MLKFSASISSLLVLNFSILTSCQTELQKVCDELAHLAHTLVGCDFDLGSPREVANVSEKLSK